MEDIIEKLKQYEAAIKLSCEDELFFNTSWWDEKDKNRLIALLKCNDTFGYSCADCEDVDFSLLPYIWNYYKRLGWPFIVDWISEKRGNCKPIPEVEKMIKDYEHKEIKELEIGFDEETRNKPKIMIAIYEKAFDIAVEDDIVFIEKQKCGKITPVLYDRKKHEFVHVKWEDLLRFSNVQEFLDNNNFEKWKD